MAGGMGRAGRDGVPLAMRPVVSRPTAASSAATDSAAPTAGEDRAGGPRRTRLVLVTVESGTPIEGFVIDWAQDRDAGGWVALVLTAHEDQNGAVRAVQQWIPSRQLTPVRRRP